MILDAFFSKRSTTPLSCVGKRILISDVGLAHHARQTQGESHRDPELLDGFGLKPTVQEASENVYSAKEWCSISYT